MAHTLWNDAVASMALPAPAQDDSVDRPRSAPDAFAPSAPAPDGSLAESMGPDLGTAAQKNDPPTLDLDRLSGALSALDLPVFTLPPATDAHTPTPAGTVNGFGGPASPEGGGHQGGGSPGVSPRRGGEGAQRPMTGKIRVWRARYVGRPVEPLPRVRINRQVKQASSLLLSSLELSDAQSL